MTRDCENCGRLEGDRSVTCPACPDHKTPFDMAPDNTTVEHITLEVPPKAMEFGKTVTFLMETAQDVFDWYERLCDDGAAPILYESPNEGDLAERVVCKYALDEGVEVRVIGEIKR